MAGKFVLKLASNGKFYFNLKASNGETILQSQMYTTKAGAEKGVNSVRVNGPLEERYERKVAKNGEPYFVLKAANGEIIGQSEIYSSQQAMEKGIASVKRNAAEAGFEDKSQSAEV